MSCCAVSCPSRTTIGGVKNPELSFHTFPMNLEIRNEWIKAVRRENWHPTKYSRLCSKHFEESSFQGGLSMKKLKKDAVPTIFETYPKYYQPVVKKKRKLRGQSGQDLELTPSKQNSIEDRGFNTDDPSTTPRWAKDLKSLSKVQKLASRRLRLVKSLRETQRRLLKKNASLAESLARAQKKALRCLRLLKTLKESKREIIKMNARLTNIINNLNSQGLVDSETLDVLASISEMKMICKGITKIF